MKELGRVFESLLWRSRLLVIVAVVASLALAIVMFFVATTDAVHLVAGIVHYADPELSEAARQRIHLTIVSHVAEIVDGYLLATIMVIFALALYELFVGKIDVAEGSEVGARVLVVRSVDDLKERLAKVVFLILLVRYFQFALDEPVNGPLDLLYLAVGIVLVALALYLTSRREGEPRTRRGNALRRSEVVADDG